MTVSDDTRHLPSHAVSGDPLDRRNEPYDEILRLTLQQREAIECGDLERLLSLLARRERMLASLPAGTDGVWEQTRRQAIAELDMASEASLLTWREQVIVELGLLQRGQTGLGGYRVGESADAAFIDQAS